MLYAVNLAGRSGYVYVLFEHKSYVDGYVHLQLLEYLIKIWRLCLKQQAKDRPLPGLPLVIPLLIAHGQQSWPEDRVDFASLFDGPVDILKAYVPDYRFELYDLTGYADERIHGTIMLRVVLLLFKHIRDTDVLDKLPGILALLRELMCQETGLRCLEVVLRYLFSTLEDVSAEELKQAVETALSSEEGGYIMTLSEKFRREGHQKGHQEGHRKGGCQMLVTMVRNARESGLSEYKIAQIVKLDLSVVRQILNQDALDVDIPLHLLSGNRSA